MKSAIEVNGLGKRYQLGAQRQKYSTLRDALGAFFKRNGEAKPENGPTEFWALKDVGFEVKPGDVIGIVGRNGAGKSTLLRILSRITEPTEGRAVIRGRIGSLLEVGTGFHAELTGRENVFLNGAILGMTRKEIARKFDEIVAFAEVEKFLDTPVKFYSSGMYMRLAFAVAAHLEPEILVVDEVLAVGDAEFQQKCLAKMDGIAHEGRTILFVSHNMSAIQKLCTTALHLKKGRVVACGAAADIVGDYVAETSSGEVARFDPSHRMGDGDALIADVRLVDERGAPAQSIGSEMDLRFEIDVEKTGDAVGGLSGLSLQLRLATDEGDPLFNVMSADAPGILLPRAAKATVRVTIPGPTVVPGFYRIANIFLGVPNLKIADFVNDCFRFEVLPPIRPWRPYDLTTHEGRVCRLATWSLRENS